MNANKILLFLLIYNFSFININAKYHFKKYVSLFLCLK